MSKTGRADLATGGAEGSTETEARGRLWLNDGSCVRLRPEHANHVWSYDFVEGRTHNGRKFRMLNIIDEFTRECLAIRIDRKLNSTDVIDDLSDLSSCAACLATFVLITGRSSSPRQCGSGLQLSAQRPRSSSPGAHGRTATARSSTRSFATSCSTARSSTASPRPRSSSKHGGATTTPSDHTHRSDTDRRLRRPLSGLQSQPDRFRQQRKQSPKSPSCIKTESGPPHRGRPIGDVQKACRYSGRWAAKRLSKELPRSCEIDKRLTGVEVHGIANVPWGYPDYSGLTLETVSRALSRLHQAGVLDFNGHNQREIVSATAGKLQFTRIGWIICRGVANLMTDFASHRKLDLACPARILPNRGKKPDLRFVYRKMNSLLELRPRFARIGAD